MMQPFNDPAFNEVTDEQREACAIIIMRQLITLYAEKHGLSFNEAFFRFTHSRAYDALFDYETALWKEGAPYVLQFFEELINR